MKRYLRHVTDFATALLHYATRGGLFYACQQMQVLNIWVRRNGRSRSDGQREHIYDRKNRLVQLLYERGYCVEARLDVDRKPCWGYRGQGCDGIYCEKCDGTGIFREDIYYAFTFELPEPGRPGVCELDDRPRVRRFRWHQPQRLVTWKVALTHSGERAYQPPAEDRPLPALNLVQSVYLLWWALALHGAAPHLRLFDPVLPGLSFKRIARSGAAGWSFQAYIPLLCLRLGLSDNSLAATWPSLRQWDPWWAWYQGLYRDLDWLGLCWRRADGFNFMLAGRSPREWASRWRHVPEPVIDELDEIPF